MSDKKLLLNRNKLVNKLINKPINKLIILDEIYTLKDLLYFEKPVFIKNIFNIKNIQYYYNIPLVSNTIHGSNIENIYSHFLTKIDNNKIYNINSWPFLNINNIKTYKPIKGNNIISYDIVYLIRHETNNVGHSFTFIMHQIYYYHINNLNCKILISENLLKLSKFISSLIYLFFNIDDIIIINKNHKININNCYFCTPSFLFNWCYIDKTIVDTDKICAIKLNAMLKIENIDKSINFLLEKLNLVKLNTPLILNKSKLCIIKSYNNINIDSANVNKEHSISRAFSEDYINFFDLNGFSIIKCEDYNIIELYSLLSQCKIVVLSWGCVSYLNKIFFNNTNLKVLILAHNDYQDEYKGLKNTYDFIPIHKFCTIIFNLKSGFDNETEKILNEQVNIINNI